MWHPFWYNLPCFHLKGDYNHHHELNIVDGSIGLTMKLLLLHMHVIVNMKNLFEHAILGNRSWFFWKTSKPQTKVIHTCAKNHMQLYVLLGWDNMIATSKSSTKIHGFTPLIGEVHFIFDQIPFSTTHFSTSMLHEFKIFIANWFTFFFWQQLFNTLIIINPIVPPFNQGCCFCHLIAFNPWGTLVKKIKKYVNTNIGCNILVVE